MTTPVRVRRITVGLLLQARAGDDAAIRRLTEDLDADTIEAVLVDLSRCAAAAVDRRAGLDHYAMQLASRDDDDSS